MAKSTLGSFLTFLVLSLFFNCHALGFFSSAFALSPLNSDSSTIYLDDVPDNSTPNHVNDTLGIPSKSVVQAQLKKRTPQDFLQVSLLVLNQSLLNKRLRALVLGEGTVPDGTPFERTKRPQ